jgi:hypothetical protein
MDSAPSFSGRAVDTGLVAMRAAVVAVVVLWVGAVSVMAVVVVMLMVVVGIIALAVLACMIVVVAVLVFYFGGDLLHVGDVATMLPFSVEIGHQGGRGGAKQCVHVHLHMPHSSRDVGFTMPAAASSRSMHVSVLECYIQKIHPTMGTPGQAAYHWMTIIMPSLQREQPHLPVRARHDIAEGVDDIHDRFQFRHALLAQHVHFVEHHIVSYFYLLH